jgi:geranylgeranyl transferase type-2 subunit beta
MASFEGSEEIEFCTGKHVTYIRELSADTESFEYLVTQHLRMSGVYWGLTASALLGTDLKKETSYAGMVEWILQCQDPVSGGFGGNVNHDPHMLYTLSALQILALYDQLDVVDSEKVGAFVSSLQMEDGSFAGDKWGEIDTRFSYCALSIMSILGQLDCGKIDKVKAIDFVARYAYRT